MNMKKPKGRIKTKTKTTNRRRRRTRTRKRPRWAGWKSSDYAAVHDVIIIGLRFIRIRRRSATRIGRRQQQRSGGGGRGALNGAFVAQVCPNWTEKKIMAAAAADAFDESEWPFGNRRRTGRGRRRDADGRPMKRVQQRRRTTEMNSKRTTKKEQQH